MENHHCEQVFIEKKKEKQIFFSCLGAMIYTKIEFVKWRGGDGVVCA